MHVLDMQKKHPYMSFHILAPAEAAGNRTSKRQICLQGCGKRPFLLATGKVSRAKENTGLFLKLKIFMPEMNLSSI